MDDWAQVAERRSGGWSEDGRRFDVKFAMPLGPVVGRNDPWPRSDHGQRHERPFESGIAALEWRTRADAPRGSAIVVRHLSKEIALLRYQH
jgi:hypothetical protein